MPLISTIVGMEFIGTILTFTGKLLIFVVVSIIFLPCFLVVTFLHKPWSELLDNLF